MNKLFIDLFFGKWKILILLLLCNFSNPYFGSVALFAYLGILIFTRLKIPLRITWRPMASCWTGVFMLPILSFTFHYSSFNNLFWYLFTNSSIILFPFILSIVNNNDVIRNGRVFLKIQAIIFGIQYIWLSIRFKNINPFAANMSAGDFFTGTSFGNSSTISVTMAVMVFIFFSNYAKEKQKKDMVYAITAFTMMILTGYMAGIFLFFCSILFYSIFNFVKDIATFRLSKTNMLVVSAIVITMGGCYLAMHRNFQVATSILFRVVSISPPVKIQSYITTLTQFSRENPLAVYTGVGAGNYGSRAAFMVSGHYLRPTNPWYVPITPSKYYLKYIYPLFEATYHNETIGGIASGSMINTPFSDILAIFGEGGIFALLLLIAIFYLFFKNASCHKNGTIKIALLFLFSLLLIDNWLAYPSYSLAFWLLNISAET